MGNRCWEQLRYKLGILATRHKLPKTLQYIFYVDEFLQKLLILAWATLYKGCWWDLPPPIFLHGKISFLRANFQMRKNIKVIVVSLLIYMQYNLIFMQNAYLISSRNQQVTDICFLKFPSTAASPGFLWVWFGFNGILFVFFSFFLLIFSLWHMKSNICSIFITTIVRN